MARTWSNLCWLVQLNKVAASIRQHGDGHRACFRGFAGENDTSRLPPRVLIPNIVNLESSNRNSLSEQRFLERFSRRICIWFKGQLQLLGAFGRDDPQPFVIANGEIVLLLEAEHVCVESQCFFLVIYHDAGEADSQCSS